MTHKNNMNIERSFLWHRSYDMTETVTLIENKTLHHIILLSPSESVHLIHLIAIDITYHISQTA